MTSVAELQNLVDSEVLKCATWNAVFPFDLAPMLLQSSASAPCLPPGTPLTRYENIMTLFGSHNPNTNEKTTGLFKGMRFFFDNTKYPPTDEGWNELQKELKLAAFDNGTVLQS